MIPELDATLGTILILATLASGLVLIVSRTRHKVQPSNVLSDSATIIVNDGRIKAASEQAVAILGRCEGSDTSATLERLFGGGATVAASAIEQIQNTGEPFSLLLDATDGKPFEVSGTPTGALIRITLRDATDWKTRLDEAVEIARASDARAASASWEQQTLRALMSEAPIIAWRRTASGEILWSSGEIETPAGTVGAGETVRQLIARSRPRSTDGDIGRAQKWRIELVVNDQSETAALHVIEIWRGDDTFIGFATDASNAVSAERTLTRFVQTMTETFAHLTVGLAIFDRNQTLALFNPTMLQMWKVEPAWLARRPALRDIVDELRATRRLPEQKDFHEWRARLLSLFDNTEAADYEELWNLADGSIIRVLARPHPHGSLAFIFDDVTERMRLEQRYRHSIELRRASLDQLEEGIAVFGANGLLQFVNQAFHRFWETDSDTIYPAMHARHVCNVCRDLSDEPEMWQRFYTFITSGNDRTEWTATLSTAGGRQLMARFAPLPDGSAMMVLSDVTDPQRRALRLIEAETARRRSEAACARMSSDLLAIVQQDTTQPIRVPSSVRINATLLREESAPEGLHEILEETFLLLEPTASARGIVLTCDGAGTESGLASEYKFIGIVAFLLLEGTINQTPDDGRIVLSGTVSDNGIDIVVEYGQGPDSHVSFGDFGGAFRDLKDLVASRHGRVLHEHPTSGLASRVVCRFGSTPHTIETLQGPNEPIDEMPELEAEDTRDAPTGYGHSA